MCKLSMILLFVILIIVCGADIQSNNTNTSDQALHESNEHSTEEGIDEEHSPNEQELRKKEKSLVIDLTPDTIETTIKSSNYLLVLFYDASDHESMEFMEEYDLTAEKVSKHKDKVDIKVAKIDCLKYQGIMKSYEVQVLPHFKYFKFGEGEDFDGVKFAEELTIWLLNKSKPYSIKYSSYQDLRKFIDEKLEVKEVKPEHDNLPQINNVIVTFFGKVESEAYSFFIKLAKAFDDLDFIHFTECQSADCYSAHKADEDSILLQRRDEYKHIVEAWIKKPYNLESLSLFIKSNMVNDVSTFDENCAALVFAKHYPALVFITDKDSREEKEYNDLAKELTKKAKGIVQIVTSEYSKDETLNSRLMDYFKIFRNDVPTIRILDPRTEPHKKYTFDKDRPTLRKLEEFIDEFKNDKLQVVMKSEDPPTHQDSLVLTVVGKTWESIVMDKIKDVVVLFYVVEDCNECEIVIPMFDQLADHFYDKEKHPHLIFGKLDHYKNDIEHIEGVGYPSVVLYLAQDKENPIFFSGEHSVENFTKFLDEHLPQKPKLELVQELAKEKEKMKDDL